MKNQKANIRWLFESKPNQWIPLYEIMRFAAQYNARIHELRREGMKIECKIETVNGERHTWYRHRIGEMQEKMFS